MFGSGFFASLHQRLFALSESPARQTVSAAAPASEAETAAAPALSQRPIDVLLRHCDRPLTLIDVGARWGAHERWSSFGEAASLIGFEPDAVECARLNVANKPNVRYLPIGLAEAEGTHDLYAAIEPACSSLLPPV